MTSLLTVVKDVQTTKKVVAFTFDDGPHPIYTQQIMKVFKENDAKGTFYVTGEHVEQYPEIARQLIEEGHEIGNHTYSHPRLAKLTPDETYQELERTDKIIQQTIGLKAPTFRPPYGSYNEQTVEVANKLGYEFIYWSDGLDTKDFSSPGTDKIIEQVKRELKNGSIILMHDSSEEPECNRDQTVEALSVLLPELKSQGYDIVTVSDLLKSAN